MKIVKFKDGTFAIRTGWFPCYYKYLDKDTNEWWKSELAVSFYCTFNTLEEAITRLEAKTAKRDWGTLQ